jgi:hypothetical protein
LRRQSLLELDPGLAALLAPEHRTQAREALSVDVRRVSRGPLDLGRLEAASPVHIGLLVVRGIVSRDVRLSDTVSSELLGAGDLIRPWALDDGAALLGTSVRWTVVSDELQTALLDRRLAGQLSGYPEVNVALIDRLNERSARLAMTQAISQLHRVDRRLTALFWHLAERWGRMTGDGVLLPLRLSHRMLAQLVGARRPTVSTALRELTRSGEVVRRSDGSWLLHGDPVDQPATAAAELTRVASKYRRTALR